MELAGAIGAANLAALYTGFDMKFGLGMASAGEESHYAEVCTEVPSSTRMNAYPFLGRTTRFREWVGPRVVQNLEAHEYTLINKHFEDTIAVYLDDLKDDNHGIYAPMFEDLGRDAKVHPDMLLGALLQAAVANIDAPSAAASMYNGILMGPPVGYDGKTLFSASHPVGLAGETTGVANVDSGGSGSYWFLIDAGKAIRPFIWQLREAYKLVRMNAITDEKIFDLNQMRFGVDGRANIGVGLWQFVYASNQDLSNPASYGAARAAMRQIKTDAGVPFGAWSSPPAKRFLMVPSDLEEVATQLMHGEFGAIEGASGAVAGVPGTNLLKGNATLIVNDYLS